MQLLACKSRFSSHHRRRLYKYILTWKVHSFLKQWVDTSYSPHVVITPSGCIKKSFTSANQSRKVKNIFFNNQNIIVAGIQLNYSSSFTSVLKSVKLTTFSEISLVKCLELCCLERCHQPISISMSVLAVHDIYGPGDRF